MDTTNKRWMQLYLFAAAALLIVAMAAITLTAGPAQAQGGIIVVPPDPRIGDNEDFYDEPYPCSEEAQPDENTESVIREGYYALFDAFWDYEVGHLSDNFCPPGVTVTKESNPRTGVTTTTYTRSDAKIHISETAFSVPDSYKVTVIDSRLDTPAVGNPGNVEGPTIDIADYPFLKEAVSAIKPGPDSTAENPTWVFADNEVWWVRLDEPDTEETQGVDETSPLQIGFSTALMKDADWHNPNGDAVQFHFGAVHVLEAGAPVETHVVGADFFAFEQRAADTPLKKAQWSNLETAAHSEINMAVGKYRPMQFLFTKPGEYLVQAQIQGHVRKQAPEGESVNWTPINPGDSVTSPTEWYTFLVGPVADVGVSLTHTDETPNDDSTTVTDGTASFSVTATNSGPSTSEGVVVEVSLPVGLDYVADASHTGVIYECGVISWRVGDLTASGESSSKTLNFTARVGAEAPKSLTVDAAVHSSTVDENEENDTASVEVLSNSTVVRSPFFGGATLSVPENAIRGTHVGDPVAVNNPDGRALAYTLSGRCSGWFTVYGHGQIAVGWEVDLDYDEQSEFHLTLSVSDGVDASGAADTAIDDSEPVTISVVDLPSESAAHPTVSFSLENADPIGHPSTNPDWPRVGDFLYLVPTVNGLPQGVQPNYYRWGDEAGGLYKEEHAATSKLEVGAGTAGEKTYVVHIKWNGGGITASYTINWLT